MSFRVEVKKIDGSISIYDTTYYLDGAYEFELPGFLDPKVAGTTVFRVLLDNDF